MGFANSFVHTTVSWEFPFFAWAVVCFCHFAESSFFQSLDSVAFVWIFCRFLFYFLLDFRLSSRSCFLKIGEAGAFIYIWGLITVREQCLCGCDKGRYVAKSIIHVTGLEASKETTKAFHQIYTAHCPSGVEKTMLFWRTSDQSLQ